MEGLPTDISGIFFVKLYFFFLLALFVACIFGVLALINKDRRRIFMQKDNNYISYFFTNRKKDATVFSIMWTVAAIMFIALFVILSIAKR